MTDCRKIRTELYAYLDRETSREEIHHALEHLEKCHHCFTHYEIVCLIRALLRKAELNVFPREQFRREVAERLVSG